MAFFPGPGLSVSRAGTSTLTMQQLQYYTTLSYQQFRNIVHWLLNLNVKLLEVPSQY